MEQHPLQSLVDLIEFDKNVIKKEQELAHVHKTLDHLERDKERLQHEQDASAQRLNEAKKEVHAYELTMKELDATEKEKRTLLDSVASQAAYDALKKEIAHLKKSQYDHERQLVQRWKVLESAQKAYDELGALNKTKTNALEKNIQEQATLLNTLKNDLEQLYQQRTEKETHVPKEWLVKYTVMRAHTVDPIVSLEYESCGGCFAQLPPQDLMDLRRKRLIQCSSCYRFIYLPATLLEEEEASMTEKDDTRE